ncbi:MAG: Asp-tRNA(Asn)/Glu-tRNA(Gln) amidotransferase subunit GatB [Firmicutes bacterium]|nr:Asp-tRNA(Asn)/Glu-tRNA(Gln) amidotransferase subunit GatB [Bacillota bacterium]
MRYETVIGLEVHVELKTKAKLWCGCSTQFGAEPNTQVCPVCLGLPGGLPILNKKAVELALTTGLALNCVLAEDCRFDRKHYFYPDLPKGYQITQFYQPIGREGWLEVEFADGPRRVRIKEIHLEEEAGRTYHLPPGPDGVAASLLDYNRSGIPLLEIVTAPELSSPEQARVFLEELKAVLECLEVSDAKMEEGSFRCDANLSVRRPGEELGKRVELKNLNSFRAIEAGLVYEEGRQRALLAKGEPLRGEEVRAWDEEKGITVYMREKEQAADYRYFPEPEIPAFVLVGDWIEALRTNLPEIPLEKRRRYREVYQLATADAALLSRRKAEAAFFEATLQYYQGGAQTVANWILGELTRLMKETKKEVADLPFSAEDFAALLNFQDQKVISSKIAKAVLAEMFRTGTEPAAIIEQRGWQQITDPSAVKMLVRETLAANSSAVQDYLGGKQKAFAFFVGDVMRKSKGRANPELLNEILRAELERCRSVGNREYQGDKQ